MKLISALLTFFLLQGLAFAQSPEKMSYQAIVTNASNMPLISQSVGMRISILQGSATGTPVYVETHLPSTNPNGLVSLEVGAGTTVSGNFSNINWGNSVFFIKTETDPNGGSNYTITGTTQLLSVPFALYAKTSGSAPSSPTIDRFYVGKDTLGGIVFYVEKDQNGIQHGLIVSKTQLTGARYQGPTTSTTNATSTWDGVANTNLMTASSAKNFATGLGAGWYLPAIDELSLLYQNRYAVNKALDTQSAAEIPNSNHWSSTERSSSSGYYFSFSDGHASNGTKTSLYRVRAIKSF